MNYVDKQYTNTVINAMSGSTKIDRTGVGTNSTFGQTMRFDLSNGKLPLLTTKKVFLRAIIHELLWMLTGDTNIRYLKEHGVSIWDAWIDLSTAEYVGLTDDEIEEAIKREENVTSIVFDDMVESGETYIRFKDSLIFLIDPIQADRWGQAYRAVFEQEPKRLVAGDLPKVYGKQWRYWDDTRIVSAEEVTEKEASGFTVVGEVTPGRYAIQREIDQIANVIEQLKHNPDSRRIVVSAWNVGEIDEMALPPCHSYFQFWTRELSVPERGKWLITHRPELGDAYTEHVMEVMPFDWDSDNTTEAEVVKCVEEETVIQTRLSEWMDTYDIPKRALSCQFYMRSNDVALGNPFNIVQYALLTHMIAHVCGMVSEDLIWVGGDTHVYSNQWEGLQEQLGRKPLTENGAKLWLNPDVTSIDDFSYDDIGVEGYLSHPSLKFPTAAV